MTVHEFPRDHGSLANLDKDHHPQYLLKESGAYVAQSDHYDTPGVSLQSTTNKTIANSTWTTYNAFTSGTEMWDTHDLHDVSSNNQRITIPSDLLGRFEFTVFAEFAPNGTGQRAMRILLNGSPYRNLVLLPNSGGALNWRASASVPGEATTAGDYFEMQVWQNSGGDLVLTEARFAASYFGPTTI